MRVGDLVRFRTNDLEVDWSLGLLMRYDTFTKIAEIMKDECIYYAPGRLVKTHQRGKR